MQCVRGSNVQVFDLMHRYGVEAPANAPGVIDVAATTDDFAAVHQFTVNPGKLKVSVTTQYS